MTSAFSRPAGAPVPHGAQRLSQTASVEDLREAFEGFTHAAAGFASTYESLQSRLRDLDVRLEAANEELQANLAEKERLANCLEAVMGALPVGVIVVDQRGCIVRINTAVRRMLDLGGRPLLGCRLDEALAGIGDARAILRSLSGDFTEGQTVEIVLDSGPGAARVLEVVLLAADHEHQADFGGVLVFHDVTELKRLEKRSATVSRLTAMGEMAMNVAHEIRNPLGSIELFASALARDLEDRPHQHQMAQFISSGVRSIESIVENILQFNRPRKLAREPLEARAVIAEAMQYAQHLLEQRAVEVCWRVDDADCVLSGDPQLLKQVFLNLILNAAQAMNMGGRLEIAIRRLSSAVMIQIADDGPGVPAELLPKIFDPFISTKPKGTGLGLTIVHNIVTAHGGSIEIGNRQDGGAWVAIELPRAMETEAGLDAELEYAQEA